MAKKATVKVADHIRVKRVGDKTVQVTQVKEHTRSKPSTKKSGR